MDLLQLHAQQPFYGGNHLPASIVTRRTQESSGTCLSGDFRVVSNARPEVSACYFDNGTTNYGLPQYTENGEFASGQFWVFPYFEDYRGGVRLRVYSASELSFGSLSLLSLPGVVCSGIFLMRLPVYFNSRIQRGEVVGVASLWFVSLEECPPPPHASCTGLGYAQKTKPERLSATLRIRR